MVFFLSSFLLLFEELTLIAPPPLSLPLPLSLSPHSTLTPTPTPTDIYASGVFNYAGTGTPVNNLAKFSNGNWEPVNLSNNQKYSSLASFDSILYYTLPVTAQSFLPIGAIDTASGNTNLFAYLPVVTATGTNQISAFSATEDYVFVGGSFQVSLPDGTLVNNGISSVLSFFFITY